ncbi:MAG: histidine ammonia-lyase [Phycisphaerae bacterium]|nr:histidine ammonia-lyase [Phycisphaerae bacterium]
MDTNRDTIQLDGSPLSIDRVAEVAAGRCDVELGEAARGRMQRARDEVERIATAEDPVYGLNTGFGSLSRVRIESDRLEELQINIVRSHASGVGEPLPREVVRAMMVLLAASLARGHSGVRPMLVDRLVEMLRLDIVPSVPSRGSVGASGDLAPLAHLALSLLGEGDTEIDGTIQRIGPSLKRAGLEPLHLGAKEGLALLNGTHLMAACCSLAMHRFDRILEAGLLAAAMSMDACRASHGPLDADIHAVRRQPGQIAVAARLRELLEGSTIVEVHRENDPRVQDPYSLRAIPQVVGAAADAADAVRRIVEFELGAVTDNPLVFGTEPDEGPARIVSGGNFHGMPLAIHLDLLRIAMTHVAGISERRIFWVLSGHDVHNPVTPYLAQDPGLQSGLMIAQYTAAACVSEMQTIANPASVANIPTSAGIEDYNSMGATSGLLALRSLDLLQSVISIELLVMAQAIEHQRPHHSGALVEAAHDRIREVVPPLSGDRAPAPDIARVERLIESGPLV